MQNKVEFTVEPEPVNRIVLKGVLSEDAKRDNKFEDHRKHFLTIDELPDELSQGLSEDKRRLYDITYYLRKRDEKGERYQVKVKELADSINRSLVFEFEYFDKEEEDIEHAVSRLLDSIKEIIQNLDQERYKKFLITEEVYGVNTEPLFNKNTTPDLEDDIISSEDGVLDTDKVRHR